MSGRDLGVVVQVLPMLIEGAKMTVILTVLALLFGSILGLISSMMRISRYKILNLISFLYTWIIRGTPLLVQIFIWYFGLPAIGINLDPFVAGVLALSICEGAYISEIFRGGIRAIDIGQKEAALSLGMSEGQSFKKIVLPQAFKVIIPPFGNECITAMKDTALVSTITLVELMRKAQLADATYFSSLTIYLTAAAMYLLMTTAIMLILYFVEKRMKVK